MRADPPGIPHAGLPPVHQGMKIGGIAPLSVILDIFNRGSRVFAFFFVREENDTGFPITNVGNDGFGVSMTIFIPMTN